MGLLCKVLQSGSSLVPRPTACIQHSRKRSCQCQRASSIVAAPMVSGPHLHVLRPALVVLVAKAGDQQGVGHVVHLADLAGAGGGMEEREQAYRLTSFRLAAATLYSCPPFTCINAAALLCVLAWMGLPLQKAPPLRDAV